VETIWITDLLVTAGIPKADVAWNATASEDELDLMVDVLGPRVFFELKDREFGLGDAYPFSYRVARYGGVFGVVVTTDKVAGEAKKFFDEQRPNMRAQIVYLEGQGTIEQEANNLIDQVSRNGVMLLLSELAESLPLDLIPVMNAWMHHVAESATAPDRILQLKAQSVVAEL
jgi:hypothetical protein